MLTARACLLLAACFVPPAFAQKKAPEPPKPNIDLSQLQPGLYAVMTTTMGVITAQLFEKETPLTVANFIGLARGTKPWRDPKTKKYVTRPFYENMAFHRVIPQFMIQIGDPTGVGNHDCGFTLPDEIVPKYKFDRGGRLAMANAGPGTGQCQFFITELSQTHLNGKHTIFGQVVDGQEVVGKIARVVRDSNDKPLSPIRMLTVTFLRIPEPAAEPAPQ